MALSDWLKGLVIFVMVFTGIFTFINLNASNYGYQQYNNPVANRVMNDVQDFSNTMQQKIQNLQTSSGIMIVLDYFGVAFTGTIEILKLFITTLPNTIILVINWLAIELGLPSWFVSGIIVIGLISIISYIIYILMKVKL
jgi:hypothetical protein